ncbi:MAG TPA: carbohydrate ABC transporter permease [Candidatus Acidoferrum sp.]|nr:carbohydrate ABC transporter permease [Candidatus Acidoferrum sp.]
MRRGAVARPGARRYRQGWTRHAILIGLSVLLLLTLAPFLIVVLNAVKSPVDYAAEGPISLPRAPTLSNIVDFWNRVDFTRKLLNSLIVSGSVAVLGVALSVMNAYALGIGRVRGRIWFLFFFLAANLLPQEALVYPLYYMAKAFHIYNSLAVVIIIFTVIQGAFGTYLLSSVYDHFPRDLLDAASIDGAGRWRALVQIVLPVSWPTLSVLFAFFFIWTWNEFFLPLVFLISNDKQTVPVALAVLQGEKFMSATATSASALVGILPAVLFFLLFQRTLIRGIAAGAIK